MKEQFKNPVWSALNETHKHLSIDYKLGKFYDPEVCNFGAFPENKQTESTINNYAKLTDDFYVVGKEKPLFDAEKINLIREVSCNQMVLKKIKEPFYKDEIIKLNESHIKEVYDLVWLVMPGYYKKQTFNLGSYYGIFKENKLVAITGERLQSNIFIEVSAVVTHPSHIGNGYAKQLVAHTTKHILKQNKVPILHVAENNKRAISLYKKIGYEILQKIVWRNFVSKK